MAIGMGGRKDDEDGRRAASGVGQLAQSPGQDAFVVRADAFGDDRCASGRCGMRAEHGAGDGMRRVAAPRIGYGQRRFGYAAGGQPLAGMHAEQAGILPRKAEAAEQGLKRRDSRMVRKVVAGRAECCERAAESMVEGVARGQHHDAFPLPAQREDFFRVLSGAAPNDPGVFHRDGAQRHKGARAVHRVRLLQQSKNARVGGESCSARNDVDVPRGVSRSAVCHMECPCMK